MATESLWRPFDRKHIADPYAMYKRMREEDPVHRAQTGEWIITRYEDARSILRSGDYLVGNRIEWMKKSIGYFFEKKGADIRAIETAMQSFILFLNPPHHTRVRKFVQQVWNTRDVESIIRGNLEELLSGKKGQIDLVHDLGKPLPAMTIGKILGLPPDDYMYLKELGSTMIKALDMYISLKDILSINESSEKFIAYFEKIVKDKEAKPDNGIISRLIEANRKEGVLQESELISTCILLFIAGEETSIGLMSTGLFNLLSNKEVMRQLRDNPGKIPQAIEEMLRYDTPVQIVGRIASKDTVIGVRQISKGDAITICLGSANRDPEFFDRPDELLIDRTDNKHLAFGGGGHYCLGDWLARIQTQLMFETILRQYEEIELIDAKPEWNNNISIRTLTKLPVTVR